MLKLALVLAPGLLLSCGKVGDPLPPVTQGPPTTQSLRVEESQSRALLIFGLPRPGVEWVDVFRSCAGQPANRPLLIARLPWDELVEHSEPGRYTFHDRPVDQQCRYTLHFFDQTGQRIGLSNTVEFATSPGPRPPD